MPATAHVFIVVVLEVVHAHNIPHLRHGCCSEFPLLSTPKELAISGFIAKNKNFDCSVCAIGFGAIDNFEALGLSNRTLPQGL